jgi:hypothetical protein
MAGLWVVTEGGGPGLCLFMTKRIPHLATLITRRVALMSSVHCNLFLPSVWGRDDPNHLPVDRSQVWRQLIQYMLIVFPCHSVHRRSGRAYFQKPPLVCRRRHKWWVNLAYFVPRAYGSIIHTWDIFIEGVASAAGFCSSLCMHDASWADVSVHVNLSSVSLSFFLVSFPCLFGDRCCMVVSDHLLASVWRIPSFGSHVLSCFPWMFIPSCSWSLILDLCGSAWQGESHCFVLYLGFPLLCFHS